MHDVIINKVQSIQRCVKRAREEYSEAEDFITDYTRQNAAMLNVLRACELAIDLAAFVISQRKLGLPTSSREAFELLRDAGLISSQLCDRLLKIGWIPQHRRACLSGIGHEDSGRGDPEGLGRPSGFRRCHPPVGSIVQQATT